MTQENETNDSIELEGDEKIVVERIRDSGSEHECALGSIDEKQFVLYGSRADEDLYPEEEGTDDWEAWDYEHHDFKINSEERTWNKHSMNGEVRKTMRRIESQVNDLLKKGELKRDL